MAQEIFFPKDWDKVLASFNSINLYWSYPEDREKQAEEKLDITLCVAYPKTASNYNRQVQSVDNFEFLY